ncbi:Nudix family hydrolase [Thauera sinica]|uniref:8-oxo-dGTP diphosphatase n=1 Tax=Thauera sinica TaxID=2665146 RepID=A0ABW1AU72_9RHOO|nr:Nudix family hydrolase [Thauera sp. K11]ATE58565.1 DNA mismatch repair protein MutT [Thauera sp. K11]
MTRKRVEVAAGVLTLPDGRYLLGQRAGDTVYAGYWEFPGGKVEAGESPSRALCRELDEELGIHVTHLRPWLRREHVYEHAHVALNFFEVTGWTGEIRDRVHGALAWVRPEEPVPEPMLPANGPILKALRLPRLMGITQAAELGVDAQLAALDAALAGGLRLVQVREAGLEAALRPGFAREVVRRVHAHGGLVVINADPVLACEVGADGLHLPARLLAGLHGRPELPWVGASCHDRDELERAAALGLDYALLGPVEATRTHPGLPGLGWQRFGALAAGLPLPVFALGGLDASAMEMARDAGAHGIAGIRGVWKLG